MRVATPGMLFACSVGSSTAFLLGQADFSLFVNYVLIGGERFVAPHETRPIQEWADWMIIYT